MALLLVWSVGVVVGWEGALCFLLSPFSALALVAPASGGWLGASLSLVVVVGGGGGGGGNNNKRRKKPKPAPQKRGATSARAEKGERRKHKAPPQPTTTPTDQAKGKAISEAVAYH